MRTFAEANADFIDKEVDKFLKDGSDLPRELVRTMISDLYNKLYVAWEKALYYPEPNPRKLI